MIIVGNKYNNWLVIREVKNKNRIVYLCKCNCGNEKEVRREVLNSESHNCNNCRFSKIQAGTIFGKWTVLELVESEERRKHYKVKCECGTIKVLKGIRLKFGDSIQCRKCGSTKHNMVNSSTYQTWESMIQRCTNPNNLNYKYYGERGIAVCERWLKFDNFLQDMGLRPDNLELDRINNDLGYYKENCRWITHRDNLKNRKKMK